MTTFSDRLYQMGGIPVGLEVLQPVDMRWVYSSSTGAIYKHLSKRVDQNKLHSTLALAEAATTAGQNEVVFVTPNESHSLSASVTWDNNDTHLIGMTLNPMQPHVDLYMAYGSGFSPMITISGRGCYFANLTFRHGSPTTSGGSTGNATDLIGATISGRYNTFENVYFYTPLYGEQDVASVSGVGGYRGLDITGHNNYFRRCKFGSDAGRDKENFNMSIAGIGNIFEDCLFNMVADGTSPFFVSIYNTTRDMKYTLFKNCTFYAHSPNYTQTPSYAFRTDYTGNTVSVILDNCNFVNVGQISDTNCDTNIWKSMPEGEYNANTTKIGMIALRNQGV